MSEDYETEIIFDDDIRINNNTKTECIKIKDDKGNEKVIAFIIDGNVISKSNPNFKFLLNYYFRKQYQKPN